MTEAEIEKENIRQKNKVKRALLTCVSDHCNLERNIVMLFRIIAVIHGATKSFIGIR